MNKAPKFGKIELLLKGKKNANIESVEKLEFLDCGLVITGDYIIVVVDEKDVLTTTLTSTGKIYNMADILAYKTHAI